MSITRPGRKVLFCGCKSRPQPPINLINLSERQSQELLAAAESSPDLHLAVALALYCGMRQGEMIRMQWDDTNVATKSITIDGRKTYMNDTVLAALTAQHAEQQPPKEFVFGDRRFAVADRLSRQLREISVRSIHRKLTFHNLRVSYCISLLQAGLSPAMLKELAGLSWTMLQNLLDVARQSAKRQPKTRVRK